MKDKLKFPEYDGYGVNEIKKVQKLLLEDAIVIRDILIQSDVKFCLSHGTLLGAKRHNGFIPWDDDFDYFVADEDYNHAIQALQKKLPKHLTLHSRLNDPHYFHNWTRVKDLRTKIEPADLYHPDNDKLKFKCLSIDLHRLVDISNIGVKKYVEKEAIEFWNKKLESGLIKEKEFKDGINGLQTYVENKVKNIPYVGSDSSQRYCLIEAHAVFSDSIFFPTTSLEFEGEDFPVPAQTEKILETIYNNYEQPPSYNDRKSRLKKFTLIDF